MEKKIIQTLLQANRPLSVGQLESRLGIKTAKQFTLLMRTLNRLESDGRLIFSKNQYQLQEMPERTSIQGILRTTKGGYGFVDTDEESILIPQEDLNGAMNGDLVEIQVYGGTTRGYVRSIINHNRKHVSGTITKRRKSIQLKPDDEKILDSILITNSSSYLKDVGKRAIVHITSYDSPLQGEIIRIFEDTNSNFTDELSILSNFDILPDYPEDALDLANSFPDKVLEEERIGRKDLTSTFHITIDGDDAQDFDDAVYIEEHDQTYSLYVSIADVSHYVTMGSAIDQEAYLRGTSVYIPGYVVPMLPEKLCNNLCSLVPDQIRLTQTCQIELDHQGNILSYSIYPSYICSKKRETYSHANQLLEKPDGSELSNLIQLLAHVSDLVRKLRNKDGAIDFEQPEPEFQLDEEGNVLSVSPRVRKKAELLIEDFMILANHCVAKELHTKKIPGIYRTHDRPSDKKMNSFIQLCHSFGYRWNKNVDSVTPKDFQNLLHDAKDKPAYPVISMMMLRTMAKAKYSEECYLHFGLALEEYLHFTSPIRRYPDLVVHRMIRQYLYEEDYSSLSDHQIFCRKAAEQSSERERNAQQAEYAVDDFKKAQYMENHTGEEFEGIISSMTDYGFYVTLENTVEGFVRVETIGNDFYNFNPTNYTLVGKRTKQTFSIGMKVKVVCVEADRYVPLVTFRLLDYEGKENTHGTRKKDRNKTRGRKS